MRGIGVSLYLAIVLLLCLEAEGGEGRPPMNVPMTVWEQAGADRSGDIATGGIPLPDGLVANPQQLRVLNSAGKVLPAQFSALDRWRASPSKAIRWCLVSFPASLPAGGKSQYVLRFVGTNAPPPPGTPLKVTENAGGVTVVTGPLKFVVSKSSANLFDGVWLDTNRNKRFDSGEQVVDSSSDNGALLVADDWPAEKIKAGDQYLSSAGAPKSVTIEESGPVRACVCIRGSHLPKGQGFAEGLYDYTVRIYAYAGQPYVRVFYTLANSRLSRTLRTWPFKSLELVIKLQGGARSAGFLGAGGKVTEVTVRGPAVMLQDVDDSQRQGPIPSYRIVQAGKELCAGRRAPGALSVSGEKSGVTVGVRHFAEMCPKALGVDTGGLRVKLFPAEAGKRYYMLPGRRRTHEMVYLFHAGKGGEKELKLVRSLSRQELRPLAPAKWYQQSRAWFGGMSIVDPATCPRSDGHEVVAAENPTGRRATWYAYGWHGRNKVGVHACGHHQHYESKSLPYILTGGGLDRFTEAEALCRWIADLGIGAVMDMSPDFTALNPQHLANRSVHDFFKYMGAIRLDEPGRLKKIVKADISYVTFPGGPKLVKGGPYEVACADGWVDITHMGMAALQEFYLLSGDRSVLEGLEALATMARSQIRQSAWRTRRLLVEKDDPEDPGYRMQERISGWTLYELAAMYARTGNPIYAREGEFIVKGFRNRARTSPVGYVYWALSPEKKGDSYLDGFADRKCAAQCGCMFQTMIVATALAAYHRDTGDEEALDTLQAIMDHLTHFAMIRSSDGKMLGWPYYWSDYWRPKPNLAKPYLASSNTRAWRPLAHMYDATGREDYRAVSSAAHEAFGGRLKKWRLGLHGQSAFYPHQCPKRDRKPPAAVGDLKAKALGDGRVELLWTAPGDDGGKGRAARYQVKYSADPIVERVAGWPDRTPPLPRTPAEWEAKAAAFMARNGRPFWSAANCKGEPAPRTAGTTESFTVAGLKPGKYHFALKSYDRAHNQSELSSVVAVTVR